MNDISIGAVGAAIIAGLVSVLGLVIGKEQKVSEFRQAWIDELRKCMISFIVNINAISDAIRTKQPPESMAPFYKALNEANHGIKLRLNDAELPSKNLLKSMQDFENLSTSNGKITPQNIKFIEDDFINHSKDLLKFEWKRVKRGEKTFFITKYIVIFLIFAMTCLFAYLWMARAPGVTEKAQTSVDANAIKVHVTCDAEKPEGPSYSREINRTGGQASKAGRVITRMRVSRNVACVSGYNSLSQEGDASMVVQSSSSLSQPSQ